MRKYWVVRNFFIPRSVLPCLRDVQGLNPDDIGLVVYCARRIERTPCFLVLDCALEGRRFQLLHVKYNGAVCKPK